MSLPKQKIQNLNAELLENFQDLSGNLPSSQTFVFEMPHEISPASAEARVSFETFEDNGLRLSSLDLGSADTFHFDLQAVASLSGDSKGTVGHPIAISLQVGAGQSSVLSVVESASQPGANDFLPRVASPSQAMSPVYEFIAEGAPLVSIHAGETAPAASATESDSFPFAYLFASGTVVNADINAPKPVASIAQLADYLINGFWQYNSDIAHHWGTLTITYNIDALTTAEKFLAQSALNAWHEVANITFVQTSGTANITYNHNGTTATAFETDNYNGSGIMSSATIDISASWFALDGGYRDGRTGIDSYNYQTYLHETGHALGLGHQGPYNGSATYSTNALYADDTWQYSIMSYFDQSSYGGTARYVITPQLADIYAVQQIYGAASTRTGDTVYGFNNTAGSIFNFSAYSSAPAYTIYDSGGTDTLDASGYSVAQTIDLRAGNFSSIGGLINNIGISTTTIIEKAIGGTGNDTLIANGNGDTLLGNSGNDTLIGGAGTDTLKGGSGIDSLTGSGGADTFAFALGDSSAATGQHDLITDFAHGQDKIDISGIDAIASTPGFIDMFNFLATAAFNGIAGVLDYFFDSLRGVTVVQGDTNGDRVADFAIDLTGNLTLTYDDFIGVFLPTVVIETAGSTKLTQVGSYFYLYNGGGTGPSLKLGGPNVYAGQLGGWLPIGAEAISGGYEVAWKLTGSDQYSVWRTDTNGNYTGQISGAVSGSNYVLETLETSFQQDLNGDGTIGNVLSTSVVESSGSTTLRNAANHFYLLAANGLGPTLKLGGPDFIAGQNGGWLPIAAEAISGGYEVAWKVTGNDQYSVWRTDADGNYSGQLTGAVTASSFDLQSLETSFNQDLNGDSTIGVVIATVEASGATSLAQAGGHYFLLGSGGTGPSLKLGGADFIAGQLGNWLPIGVEAISGGYQVAFKVTGGDQYSVWGTDSNGNYSSQISGAVSGGSIALQSLETSFNQDLNGDGTIGPVTSNVELSGSTSLTQAGGHYFLIGGGGTGPSLKLGGTDVVAGQLGSWSPIGAEAILGGYEVAWKLAGSDQYSVWGADTNGNYASQISGAVPGSNYVLQTLESSFHQDLNSDGTIGNVLATTTVESNGSTMLLNAASHFYLLSGGLGPTLKLGGSDFVAGQLGSWLPIGAEAISGGYEVAWKLTGSDQYSVWGADSNGNYSSQILGAVSGSNASFKSLETSFHQDLNADGVTGLSQTPSGSAAFSNAAIVHGGPGADTFAFAPNFGQATVIDFHPDEDTIQFDHTSFANTAAIVAHMADDGLGNSIIALDVNDMVTVQGVTSATLQQHLGDFHIV